jgi:hypothetical protein
MKRYGCLLVESVPTWMWWSMHSQLLCRMEDQLGMPHHPHLNRSSPMALSLRRHSAQRHEETSCTPGEIKPYIQHNMRSHLYKISTVAARSIPRAALAQSGSLGCVSLLISRANSTRATTTAFPTTPDHASSPFNLIQAGKTRTLMPTFGSLEEERAYRKEHLALVFRALHRAGMAEGVAGELKGKTT